MSERATPETDASTFYMNDCNFTPVVHQLKSKRLENQRDELLEALEYIMGDSVTFIRNTAIEMAQTAINNVK